MKPSPENCPEPFWHRTHRYCPVCTWTETSNAPVTHPSVSFLSAESLINAVDGCAVEAKGPDGSALGILHPFRRELQSDDVYMVSFADPVTGAFLQATDVRNFTEIIVL